MRPMIALLLGFLLSTTSLAETGALSFTRPTSYVDGTALPPASITGYEAKCTSFAPSGGVSGPCTYTPLIIPGTALNGVMTLTIPVVGGSACFTLETLTAVARSAPTNSVCKVFSAVPPNPPTNVTVAVVIGINVVPAYTILSSGARSSAVAGFVQVGVPCVGDAVFTYRGKSWRRVAQTDVAWWRTTPTVNVAAPCAV